MMNQLDLTAFEVIDSAAASQRIVELSSQSFFCTEFPVTITTCVTTQASVKFCEVDSTV